MYSTKQSTQPTDRQITKQIAKLIQKRFSHFISIINSLCDKILNMCFKGYHLKQISSHHGLQAKTAYANTKSDQVEEKNGNLLLKVLDD